MSLAYTVHVSNVFSIYNNLSVGFSFLFPLGGVKTFTVASQGQSSFFRANEEFCTSAHFGLPLMYYAGSATGAMGPTSTAAGAGFSSGGPSNESNGNLRGGTVNPPFTGTNAGRPGDWSYSVEAVNDTFWSQSWMTPTFAVATKLDLVAFPMVVMWMMIHMEMRMVLQ